jgi:hypothetical protein
MFGEFAVYPGLILLTAGAWQMARVRPWLFAMIMAALGLALIGSMLKAYPLYQRLLLFALPLVFLFVAQALEFLRAELSDRAKLPVLTGVLVCVMIGSLFPLADGLRQKPAFALQNLDSTFQLLNTDVQEDDMLALNIWAVPTFLIYRQEYGLEKMQWTIVPNIEDADGAVIPGMESTGACLTSIVGNMAPGSRIWGLTVRPLSTPTAPVQQPDYASILDYESLIVETRIANAQARLDTFIAPIPTQKVLPGKALCAYNYDIDRELRGGHAPLIPGN